MRARWVGVVWGHYFDRKGKTPWWWNFLQGGGTNNNNLWFVDVGPFGGNVEEGRRGTHRLTQKDHGEASVADRIQDVGYAWGGISAGSDRNAVIDYLYMETAGNCVTVGGVTADTRSLCRLKGVQGGGRMREDWWFQEAT